MNKERLEESISSEKWDVPEGLSREETRTFINTVAFLTLLEKDIDSGKVSVIPESVWERVETIKRKADLARES